MWMFGFELEGFYRDVEGNIQLPPKTYPTDGFPGLCEARTYGGMPLMEAYLNCLSEYSKYMFDTETTEHTFSRQQRTELHARQNTKFSSRISNVYDKSPRLLGNKTLASFQINISKELRAGGMKIVDNHINTIFPQYAIFDFVPIVKALDKEFASEIKESNRQPGFYSIKDSARLEYRSLPNSVFKTDVSAIKKLQERISKCVIEV